MIQKNKKYFVVIFTLFMLMLTGRSQAQELTGEERFVSFEGIYLRPLGVFGQEWKSGSGVYAGYVLPLDRQNYLPMRIGVITLNHNSSYKKDASFTIIPLHFGIRYLFLNSRFTPFVEVMNGINLIHETVDLTGRDNKRYLVRYFWQAATGLAVPLSDRLDLSIGARYNAAFYENDKVQYGEKGAMMTAFEYSAGITWDIQ
ncbi:MAG: hypothetical protein ACOYNS_13890 [Bacteroidota bacterium]